MMCAPVIGSKPGCRLVPEPGCHGAVLSLPCMACGEWSMSGPAVGQDMDHSPPALRCAVAAVHGVREMDHVLPNGWKCGGHGPPEQEHGQHLSLLSVRSRGCEPFVQNEI